MSNPYDELGKQPDFSDEQKEHFDRMDYLIHKVFHQTEEGQELLNLWQEQLMMKPSYSGYENDIQIGHNEGFKSFIRCVILTVRKVNNDE